MTSDSNQIIQLNVGGISFSTMKETLLREPNSFFETLFVPEKLEKVSKFAILLANGSYFIDRDGYLFTFILDYLRNGRLIVPQNFDNLIRLRDEAEFYQLYNLKKYLDNYAVKKKSNDFSGILENGGYITLGYRGTFAFGRDGQSDVKFRKLQRILVCGKVTLCRDVFGDTLNDSRDPDRDEYERYTSRLYLKHQSLEKACDMLAEKGFKLVATCCSGANGLTPIGLTMCSNQNTINQQELMHQRNSSEYEEQRWAHYTEYIFYREPMYAGGILSIQ